MCAGPCRPRASRSATTPARRVPWLSRTSWPTPMSTMASTLPLVCCVLVARSRVHMFLCWLFGCGPCHDRDGLLCQHIYIYICRVILLKYSSGTRAIDAMCVVTVFGSLACLSVASSPIWCNKIWSTLFVFRVFFLVYCVRRIYD